MVVEPKYCYGSHILRDTVLSKVKGEPGSLAGIMQLFGDELRKEMSKVLNRNLYMDETGRLAVITKA
jgi:hypothetical protein